jgi:hypothetical protein
MTECNVGFSDFQEILEDQFSVDFWGKPLLLQMIRDKAYLPVYWKILSVIAFAAMRARSGILSETPRA